MPSFLSSVFKRPEPLPPPPTFEEELLALGVTPEGAKHYADEMVKTPVCLDFDARHEAYFPHRAVAVSAFARLLKEVKGREISAVHLRTMNNALTEEQKAMGAEKYDISPLLSRDSGIKAGQLTMHDCALLPEEMAGLFERLPEMGVTSLWFRSTDLSPAIPAIAEALESGQITQMCSSFCTIDEPAMKRLAQGVEKSRLSHFEMQMVNKGCGKEFPYLIEALPPSLKHLSLRDHYLRHAEKDALIEKLPDLKGLKYLNVNECDLRTGDAERIARALPRTVEHLNIGANHSIMDEGVQAFIDRMNSGDSALYKTGMFDNEDGFSTSLASYGMRGKLAATEEARKEAALQKAQKDKAEEIAYAKSGVTVEEKLQSAKTPAEVKGLMFEAARFGDVGQALMRLKELNGRFSVADLTRENDDGMRLLDVFSVKRKIPEVVSADFLESAKEVEPVYEALSATDRKLFRGSDGRPSMQKIKNKIMAQTVQRALHKNRTANR
ncbi:MAG: hypothetical protein ACI4PW_08260 [Alphaproteobacteria bacterium]